MFERFRPIDDNLRQEQAAVAAEAWGGVTSPAEHDPAAFRYLVHAINPYSRVNAMTTMALDHKDGISYDPAWGDQSISMAEQPERVAERVSLSMSLIDQDHPATWGPAGLIIAAPPENIILTSESDAGAHNNNLTFLLEQAVKHGVTDGDALLEQTGSRRYNEVVGLAKRDDAHLQLQGFFYKVTSKGEPYDATVADMMRGHANRLGLPLIAIHEPGAYGQNRVQTEDGMLAVELHGWRYNLTGFKDSFDFCAIDEAFRSRFISPTEVSKALGFAVSTGSITEQQAAEVQERYAAARRERETPRAVFGDSGDFQHITFREGYGEYEHRVTFNSSGTLRRTNVVEENKQLTRMLLGAYGNAYGMDPSDPFRFAAPDVAERIVAQASEALEPEQKAALAAWYEGMRPRLMAEDAKRDRQEGFFRHFADKQLPGYVVLPNDTLR
jgi:hypothetical protein